MKNKIILTAFIVSLSMNLSASHDPKTTKDEPSRMFKFLSFIASNFSLESLGKNVYYIDEYLKEKDDELVDKHLLNNKTEKSDVVDKPKKIMTKKEYRKSIRTQNDFLDSNNAQLEAEEHETFKRRSAHFLK